MVEHLTRVRLRVAPGASRPGVVGRHGDGWKVRVSAPPEAGRANAALRRLLAERLGVPAASVVVVSGHGSRDKVVEVHGLDARAASQRLDGAAS
jgi:uncharacterized protein (TIGR00251 family)